MDNKNELTNPFIYYDPSGNPLPEPTLRIKEDEGIQKPQENTCLYMKDSQVLPVPQTDYTTPFSSYVKAVRTLDLKRGQQDTLIYSGIQAITSAELDYKAKEQAANNMAFQEQLHHQNNMNEIYQKHENQVSETILKKELSDQAKEKAYERKITSSYDKEDISIKVYEDGDGYITANMKFNVSGQSRTRIIIRETGVQLIHYKSINPIEKDSLYGLVWQHEGETQRILLDSHDLEYERFVKRLKDTNINLLIPHSYREVICRQLLSFLIRKSVTKHLYEFPGWNILESGYIFIEAVAETMTSLRRRSGNE